MTGTSPRLPSAIVSRPASRPAAQTSASAAQPGAPSRSKQASCGLTATQAGPACSISARQWATIAVAASSAGEAEPGSAEGLVPTQLRRVRIETEADLAAALLYERREPIRERRSLHNWPSPLSGREEPDCDAPGMGLV